MIQAVLIGREVITFDSLLDIEMQKDWSSAGCDSNVVVVCFQCQQCGFEALSSLMLQDLTFTSVSLSHKVQKKRKKKTCSHYFQL